MTVKKSVCIYIPLFNEQGNLLEVFRRVEAVVASEPVYEWTFLLIDNCSVDRSQELCEAKAQADARYRYVRLSRNWEAAAAQASFDFCDADAMIVLFSDLQDPPELIPSMLRKWEEGFHLVNGIVRTRHDSTLVKTLGAKIAYRLIEWLAESKMPANATDFRLMDRRMVDAVRACREWPRFTRGLVHWVGFKKSFFEYDRAERVAGESKGTLAHSIRLTWEAILNFSDKPLRLISVFGLVVLLVAVLLAVIYGTGRLLGYPAPRGITTVFILALANIGLTSFFLGLIGEYLGRCFTQAKGRPLYFVEKTINVESGPDAP
jgi:glycosyltransferase involved in cell wall biosynthesis